MGTRETDQPPLLIAASDLPTSPGHPFYGRVNAILDDHGFDRVVEAQCRRFYAPVMGRPSLAPGQHFRLLLVGYFEGIDSERGIAWRAADSLAIRLSCGWPSTRWRPTTRRSRGRLARSIRNASRCLRLGPATTGRGLALAGQDHRDRCHHVGSQCGDAQHRPARCGSRRPLGLLLSTKSGRPVIPKCGPPCSLTDVLA